MRALLFSHEVGRYLLSRFTNRYLRRIWSPKLAPLRLVERDLPRPTHAGWTRLRVSASGICGSDLSLVNGNDSLYLEPEASYPFVPGHELTGRIEELIDPADEQGQPLSVGDRVAVWPIFSCRARGFADLCPMCRDGWDGMCQRRRESWLGPGIAIGFNRNTGGGWSEACLAHASQLWPLPAAVGDEEAILLDPAAAALGALLRVDRDRPQKTLVIGGGTIGLLVAHLHSALKLPGSCELVARHGFQADWAGKHGTDAMVVRSNSDFRDWASDRGMKSAKVTGYGHVFDGIYDQVIVCAASQSAFRRAIDSTRPRGVISLVAAPTVLKGPDPTPLWYREISVRGIYNYAPVRWQGAWVHPYEVLLPALADRRLAFADFVTHEYPLAEYNEALTALHRRSASGAIKVVFKPAIDLHD